MEKITVYAPASIGNVSVGFDILGAAISPISGELLGDCVSVLPATTFSFKVSGRFVDKLPNRIEDNIVYQCWQLFCQRLGQTVSVSMVLEKNMPIGSGLGSSACSIVAGLVALNLYCQKPFNNEQLLAMMGELEGKISGSIHYDNVAPCFLGGVQLILEEESICQRIPSFDDWYWVMAYPGIKVSTSQARSILPKNYSRQDCINQSKHIAGFIHACYSQQPLLAARLIRDVIAEPYRKTLLPDFDYVKVSVQEMGALACGISGSGPTLFTITNKLALAENIATWLSANYIQNDEGFVHICRLDQNGARRI